MQVYVLRPLVQPLSAPAPRKRRGRFSQQDRSHSLQISIFHFHDGNSLLTPTSHLITSLGSTVQLTRRAVCSTVSSFNLIIIAAPVATLHASPSDSFLAKLHSSVTMTFCCLKSGACISSVTAYTFKMYPDLVPSD